MAQNFFLNQVKEQSEKIWQDQVCGWGLRLTLGLALVSSIGLGVVFWRLPPEVPLWFSRPWGEAQLTKPEALWLLPSSVWLVGMVSVGVAGVMFNDEKLLARISIWGAALVGFLLTYALFSIMTLVI